MTDLTEKAVEAHAQLAESAGVLEDSAGVLKDSAVQQTDSADRRTGLASDRTILAAERTYAAWIRTALTSLASGIGARTLLDKLVPQWLIGATGSVLIGFAGFCLIAAVWRDLRKDWRLPERNVDQLPSWLLIAVNSFLLLVCIAALIGLWA